MTKGEHFKKAEALMAMAERTITQASTDTTVARGVAMVRLAEAHLKAVVSAPGQSPSTMSV